MFNPPPNPSADQEYQYGNITWRFSATGGVWNIKDGTLIGGQGPQGIPGPTGATGTTGSTGLPGFGSPGVGGANAGYPYSVEINSAATPTAGKIKFTTVAGQVTSISINKTDYLTHDHEQEFRLMPPNTYLYLQDAQANGPYNLNKTAGFLLTAPPTLAGSVFTFGNVIQLYAAAGATSNAYLGLQFYRSGPTGSTGAYPSLSAVGLTTSHMLFGGFSLTGTYGLSGNSNFLFNGTACTFGGSNTKMTITGPTFAIGYTTHVHDGIFRTPAEFAPVRVIDGSVVGNSVPVSATGGSIQRFLIKPTDRFSVDIAGSGWHSLSGATETIAVIIQSTRGYTGYFGNGILYQADTSGRAPVLAGTTGGIDVVTLMRVNKGDGTSLNMGFSIARGMTAANTTIMSNQVNP